jgi:hypothetical protein
VPVEASPDLIDVVGGYQQTVTLDDAGHRIDT